MSDDVRDEINRLELTKENVAREMKIAKVGIQSAEAKYLALKNHFDLLESQIEALRQGQLKMDFK